MSFWIGFADAFQKSQDRKHEERLLREAREYQESWWKTQQDYSRKANREDMVLQALIARQGGIFGGSGGTKGSSTASAKHYIDVLTKRYNLGEEAIGRLASTGNPADLANAVKVLDNLRTEYRDEWGSELPAELVTETFEDMVITPAGESEIDWENVEKIMGVEINESIREMGSAVVVPGTANIQAPSVPKKISPEELKNIKGQVDDEAMSYAEQKLREVTNNLNILRSELNNPQIQEARKKQIKRAISRLTDEGAKIQSIIDNAQTENPDTQSLRDFAAPELRQKYAEYWPQLQGAPGFDY